MQHLFIYGTLGPGGPNEHVMLDIGGSWTPGTLKGRLEAAGWGAEMGFPGLRLDEAGDTIRGHVFSSDNLAVHWQALDDFEGSEYLRQPATVTLEDGSTLTAQVYALSQP
ncbi:gamma-glutamylcyclotransferase family protein [Cobetia sp. D5]|uniref:gamma-glutamylcyclotransferase family protein n=1 Tax=Cobetia sp. D5 TaxID=3105867 RepID=UPI002D79251C|nr:gamma-glutamylcyclotransferase family protein [Cobetia sp. D5]